MPEAERQLQKPKPWEQGGETETGSFGSWLRRQREIREISLREISETSKISLRYLEALEQDRFDLLPASVFARGFLREYAKFVGLDPDEVVNYYLVAQQGVAEPPPEEMAPPPPERSAPRHHWTQILGLAAGVVLAFALVSGLKFLAERQGEGAERPPIAPPAPPAQELPEPAVEETVERAPLRVTLDFTENCWVEAFVDDERRVSELRVQGESLQVEAQRQVELSFSNVEGVSVQVNGTPFAIPARNDELFSIDVESAQALESSP